MLLNVRRFQTARRFAESAMCTASCHCYGTLGNNDSVPHQVTFQHSNATINQYTFKSCHNVKLYPSHTHKLSQNLMHNMGNLPQWGDAHAEIKVSPVENREMKGSPFKAWSRSVHSHTCYVHCHGFLPSEFLPFRSIHLHFFFKKTLPSFSCVSCG